MEKVKKKIDDNKDDFDAKIITMNTLINDNDLKVLN